MFDWLIRNKKKIIIIIFFLLVGIPFFTHCLFKIKLNNSFWVSEWTAGEFLAYFASALTFMSTGMLSILALWQNEIIRKESLKHTLLLEEMEKSKTCPFFQVTWISENINHSDMVIEVSNITDNIALDVTINEINRSLNREKEFAKSFGILDSKSFLKIKLENGFLDEENLIQLEIHCKDIYGNNILFSVKGQYNLHNLKFDFIVVHNNI